MNMCNITSVHHTLFAIHTQGIYYFHVFILSAYTTFFVYLFYSYNVCLYIASLFCTITETAALTFILNLFF